MKNREILSAIFAVWMVLGQTLAFAQTQETVATQETQVTQETTEFTQESQTTQEEMPPVVIAPEFSDIGPGDTNYIAINYLREKGIIQGYEDGTFKPDQEVNRAEALKIVMGAVEGRDTENPAEFNFEDVKTGEWFYSYVEKAWNNYLVEGYPDGLFHPEQTINRAESLKIILLQEASAIPTTITEPPYADVSVDDWYAPYAAVSRERTLFLESRDGGGMLNAGNIMTRGEMAELIYRLLKSADGSKFGRATWYGREGVNWGTASGEKFDTNLMTAAHKTLPFGTILLVTNEANGKSVTVRINDRGPYPTGMELDLTSGAFETIASLGAGIIVTEFKILSEDTGPVLLTPIEYGF